ncbi:MAG: cation:dicarboxylase symporter family transporter [Gammaproteobacteria bacterium]|nr:cation:dicarboxylase symporter family transporter [Gammaproteobacteria bacterium]
MSLTARILLAMVLGVIAGSVLNLLFSTQVLSEAFATDVYDFLVAGLLDGIGRIFIASLKLLVVPLVFVSLVCGVTALGDNQRMGIIATKTLLLYMLTTALAISAALLAAMLIQPGVGMNLISEADFVAQQAPPLKQVLVEIFPSNPVKAMAEGKMLQVIVFSLLLGYAISRSGEEGQRVTAIFRDFEQVIMKMVAVLITLAPYGVFCLLTKLFSELGVGAIVDLAKYFLTVVMILLLHALGVYSLVLRFFTGLNPKQMYSKLRHIWAFAFSTASSGATLPITLRAVEKRLGVHNSIASFTVPLGATINMDGTAIMQGVATVFIAQVYGIPLSAVDLLTVVLTATLASVGTAAVPGVGLITLAMVLQQVGLPVEGIALIIGVDRLLDMVRTAVNITGDATVSLIVASQEGELDIETYKDPEADLNPDKNGNAAKR